ncbi:MAG: bifunctional shikimate kinase/3-dehydroquinate synthase [Deltaproteobacteria bacterium]|nr:bifunctional shikimate kinase/3-dehydroquinate synthase [Deltaproteobacteria bacterium]
MTSSTLRPLVAPVVLLGPPGAGKSTVGRRLAARLGFAYVDLDDRVGMGHLVQGGLADFRVREHAALGEVMALGAVVIAAGAGVVDTGPARERLARCCCVALDVNVDTALERIPDGTRPWLPDRAAGEPARRAAWLAREAGRAAHRAALAGDRVVDARGDADASVDAAERAVRAARIGCEPVDEVGDARQPIDGFVVADAGVAARLPRVDHVVVEAARKDAAHLFSLLAALSRGGVGRHGRVVIVGGGALLDVGGLATALHHRGTPWVAVPTTLLAMVDAALGGKTAVDVDVDGAVVRNGAGAFHPPVRAVLDPRFLATLSPAQLRHGRAEMLKHALLHGDEADIATAVDGALDDVAIARTRGIKRFVVTRDPQEAWLRMALNLGHTFAHALESRLGIPHGDSVLHGLRAALEASVAVAGLDAAFAHDARAHVRRLSPPPLPALADDDVDALLRAMRRDKKAHGGLRLVLLAGVGQPVLADVDETVVRAALRGAGGPDAV